MTCLLCGCEVEYKDTTWRHRALRHFYNDDGEECREYYFCCVACAAPSLEAEDKWESVTKGKREDIEKRYRAELLELNQTRPPTWYAGVKP